MSAMKSVFAQSFRHLAALIPTLLISTLFLSAPLLADGLAVDKQMGFQPAVGEFAEEVDRFWQLLLIIITAITIFVTALLFYVMVRFRASANPTASKTTHNTMVEVVWTIIPLLILVVIAIPSFKLLYLGDRVGDAQMTLKAIGNQWYWDYEYPDNGDVSFSALMLAEDELAPGQPRLLATDENVVLPVSTRVRLQTTANDVIHSWTIPAFRIKVDAIPGKLNEAWFETPDTPGMFYGQCSELCGKDHGYMPIAVKVVTQAEFVAWLKNMQAGIDGPGQNQVAFAAQ